MVEIVVLVKQVPDTNAKIEVENGLVDLSMVKWVTSPYDEYAIEAALRHKEAQGGKVTALTLGPDRSEKALKDAKALGVDDIARIDVPEGYIDSASVHFQLAAAITSLGGEVVYCGKSAADTGAGSTGPAIAERLGWPSVTHVHEVSFEDGAVEVIQPGSAGQARIAVSLPALITCDKGGFEPRRANVRGIMMAKKAQVDLLTPATGAGTTSIVAHSTPPVKPPGKTYEGAEHVAEVVKLLRDEANVI